ncbi:MAG: protecting protein DprA, DNA processing protein [Microgenomates group bacterium GW2011_GWC1_37_12b]|uniref:Protecting protein DprA protein n=1 Tax=Candidatus Woesebacteria bacterium GW2011_GWB1_38_8b TaxID=1618571 RepID=A0A0G0LEP9_9BACT|nr:MAG: protecting protein DprA, DNA processing protein [Microgenomates group bacterium GW2011_GWC1_37_12b]KKQ86420.1 MAG: protecting protein DprA protein [Candidatus Woesebacteria bacterium GW2011_GWB1_38_8b]
MVALYSFDAFGPARTKLLLQYFGSAKKAWDADPKTLLEIGLIENTVKKFVSYRKQFDIPTYFEKLEKLKVNVVTLGEKGYPKNLSEIDDAPPVLYFRGELRKSDDYSVAIVGTRKLTSYGREATQIFARGLSGYGITIVSGLAFGIDAIAHKEVVDAGGRGIAVLASGLDIITPFSNTYLAKILLESGGAIVSEYPLGHIPQKYDFPQRNRIISGLSKAVIVIEGARQSGTLLTASHAAEQGRTVFAVPGQITSPMSEAPHYLIANGAKIAFSVSDVIDELGWEIKRDVETISKVMPSDKIEEKILVVLANEPLHIDELGRILELKISEISAKLTVMQLKGLVKGLGAGIYKKIS